MGFIEVNLDKDIDAEDEKEFTKIEETKEIEQDTIFSQGHLNSTPFVYTTKRHTEIASVAYQLVDNFHHHVNASLNGTAFNDAQPFRMSHQGLEHSSTTNELLTSVGKQAFVPAMMQHFAPLIPAVPFIAAPKAALPFANVPLSQEALTIDEAIDESPFEFVLTRALVDLPERDTKFSLSDLDQGYYTHTFENILNEIKIKDTAQNIMDTNTTQWNGLVHIAKENRFTDSAVNTIILELHTQNLVKKLQAPDSSPEKDALIDQLVDIIFDEQYITAYELYETIADLLEEDAWLDIAKEAFHIDYDLAIEDEQYLLGEFLKVKFSETTLQSMLDEFLEDVENFNFDHYILEAEILDLNPSESADSVQQLSLQEKLEYRDFLEEIIPRIKRDQLLIANGETDDLPETDEFIDTVETDSEDEVNITTFSDIYNKIADMFDSIYGNGAFESIPDNTSDLPAGNDEIELTHTELEYKVDNLFARIMNLLGNTDDTDVEEFCEIAPEHQWDSYDTIDLAHEPVSISLDNYEEMMGLPDPRVSSSIVYNPLSEDIDVPESTFEDVSYDALLERMSRIEKLHAEAYPISLDDTFEDSDSLLLDSSSDTISLDLNTLLGNLSTTLIESAPFDMTAFFYPTNESAVDFNDLFPATILF
ncbi:hypothetical protein CC99x_006460 [Candidatus Berkiella cookevillensis]|uniref:Uncharacterized protein n=1 Tax=Candidatus Berkiella cookevillensis TaxID=437022 RepID=A0A0Q9YSN4_9GAMM|nr:hypothetical protein [Candidatus Berkiella cookevillensis]MCS5708549.1 hypothetical protein [Candidatus Berkiella cookevillensis]